MESWRTSRCTTLAMSSLQSLAPTHWSGHHDCWQSCMQAHTAVMHITEVGAGGEVAREGTTCSSASSTTAAL
jgi:hypothetical protein